MVGHLKFAVIFAFLFGALSMAIAGPALAQDADPLAGTTVEALGGIAPPAAGDRMLVTLKITMEPGAAIPAHSHPGTVILTVQSGIFETELVEGVGTVTRASVDGTPGATETTDTGEVYTMNPGDSLAYQQDVVHTMVNGGDEPLVLLVSALLDPTQPGFIFMAEMDHESTPAAYVDSD